ncbi:siphovirus Gp157 family protein [Aerococcaceae bacterium NML201209]|nr:siphovirus Gp157 family protein [Aerococcaceae bacterium NML201209]
MNLYELAQSFKEVEQKLNLADSDDELQFYADTLDSIEVVFEEKIENIAKWIKNLDAEEEALYNEEKRLNARRKAISNRKESLKNYALQAMQLKDVTNVRGEVLKINIRNNAPSLVVQDGANIPKGYYIPQEPKLDRTALKQAVKQGAKYDGVALVSSQSIVIK